MKLLSFIILAFFSASVTSFAQFGSDLDTAFGKVSFSVRFDVNRYESALTVKKDGKKIFGTVYVENVYEILHEKLEPAGKEYYMIHLYSGGAHCCSSLLIADIRGNEFVILDTGFYGNSGFSLDDLNKDGVREIISGNDMFAYAFTNYAETRFPLRIQKLESGRLKEITGEFKDELIAEIGYFEQDLNEFIKEGFACPETEDEDTFNTDAGSVKTILAAIAADYYSLGQAERGYELIEKVYKCIDKDKFIKILQEDFKLK